jgi:hypothetical protein
MHEIDLVQSGGQEVVIEVRIGARDVQGLRDFAREFIALCRDSDMAPEEECHGLYLKAKALLGLPQRPTR